jgi:hypothetical protein
MGIEAVPVVGVGHRIPGPVRRLEVLEDDARVAVLLVRLVLGARLFTLGASAVLTAWDTPTGRQLWRKDFSKTVDTSKLFCGTAASPACSCREDRQITSV